MTGSRRVESHTQPAFPFFVQTAVGPERLAANQPVVPRLDARNGFTGGYASNDIPAVCNTGLGKHGDLLEAVDLAGYLAKGWLLA